MKVNRTSLWLLVVAAPIVWLVTLSASLQGQVQRPDSSRITIGSHEHDISQAERHALSADPASEVELRTAEVLITPDGHALVHQERRIRSKRFDSSYAWVADMSRMTIRTFKIANESDVLRAKEYVRGRNVQIQAARAAGQLRLVPAVARASLSRQLPHAGRRPGVASSRLLTIAPKPAIGITPAAVRQGAPCNCCPTCTCGGWGTVTGEAWDPIGIIVARTKARLGWTSWFTVPEQNQCEMETWTIENWPDDCTAMSPTLAGTNWYRASCFYAADHWPWTDRFGYTQTKGLYWNTDFPLSFGEEVWVDQTVYLWVNGPENGAGEWHDIFGAWTSYLISAGMVAFDGVNWCSQ